LAMVLKLLLEMQDSSLRIFLDVDDLENIHDLKSNVRNSRNFALLLTEGVFERRFVLEEVSTAVSIGKNVILIWDKERCAFPDATSIPEHLREVLLHKAIIWNPERDFRKVVVNQIFSKMGITPTTPTSTPVATLAPPLPQPIQTTPVVKPNQRVLLLHLKGGNKLLHLTADKSLQDLKTMIKEKCGLQIPFTVQYLHTGFNEFVDLEDTNELPGQATIQITLCQKEVLLEYKDSRSIITIADDITMEKLRELIQSKTGKAKFRVCFYNPVFQELVQLEHVNQLSSSAKLVVKD